MRAANGLAIRTFINVLRAIATTSAAVLFCVEVAVAIDSAAALLCVEGGVIVVIAASAAVLQSP